MITKVIDKNLDLGGRMVPVDEEGYLVDPEDWDPEVAARLAEQEGLELNDDHWKVIRFVRDHYAEHQVAVDARFVIRYLAEELGKGKDARSYLFELFPYGYVKQACKVAGMRRPRAWSTG
ncbi:MAG: TusE/DsrC/DsvC family sulfur relay protein [Gammaproteobacteria bacterium]|nr:TusE/DsrC/DsvC family sulfur relay protein [Gammaproteobacteria bacterium]